MTHADMDDLYELYVLGALEAELANEIDAHLAENCAHCLSAVDYAVDTTIELAGLADPVTPPQEVRKRLLASVKPASRRTSIFVPILIAATLVLLALSLWSIQRNYQTEARLRQVVFERNRLRTAVSILAHAQTRTVEFGHSDFVTHGRVLLSPDGGLVVVGSDMPTLAQDKAFELWLIPAKGNPIPAGVFRSDRDGGFLHVAPQIINPAEVSAVAVTVEPRNGSAAPTTKPFLIVKLG